MKSDDDASCMMMRRSSSSSTKNRLQFLNLRIIKERRLLHQHRRQIVGKEREIRYLKSRVCAAEAGEGHRRPSAAVDLEMEQPLREHHQVPLEELLQVHLVRERRDEAGDDGSLHDEEELGGAGVGVEWDDAAGGEVEAGDGEAEAVEARVLGVEGRGDGGTDDVGGVSGGAEAGEDEVVGGDVGFGLAGVAGGAGREGEVGDAEVLHGGVGGGEEEEEREECSEECENLHFEK